MTMNSLRGNSLTPQQFISGNPSALASGWNVLTATVASGTSVTLTWTAAVNAAGYQVSNGLITLDVGNVTTYTFTGLTAGQSYTFGVRSYSSSGLFSGWSAVATAQPNWNDATGGTITTVSNYNGTGQTWRIHTFTGSSIFTVNTAAMPFRALVVAGGAGGGVSKGGGGGAGGMLSNDSLTLAVQAYTVTVGAGGFAPSGDPPDGRGGNGGNSSLGSVITTTGGGGGGGNNQANANSGGSGGGGQNNGSGGAGILGQGTNGANSVSTNGGNGGGAGAGSSTTHTQSGRASNISGSSVTYATGGTGNSSGGNAAANTGNGGNGNELKPSTGGTGGSGIVIVSYRIG